jgi:hypothetical protein
MADSEHDDLERAEELADDSAARNEDETTRREAFELELQDEKLSDAGTQVEVPTSAEPTPPPSDPA